MYVSGVRIGLGYSFFSFGVLVFEGVRFSFSYGVFSYESCVFSKFISVVVGVVGLVFCSLLGGRFFCLFSFWFRSVNF